MEFKVFKAIVMYLISEEFNCDKSTSVEFDIDEDKYIARVRPNPAQPAMKIMGNSVSLGITIRWGSGHQAMVSAERVAMMLSVA